MLTSCLEKCFTKGDAHMAHKHTRLLIPEIKLKLKHQYDAIFILHAGRDFKNTLGVGKLIVR